MHTYQGIARRSATPEDFDALHALLVADEEFVTGRRSRIGANDLRQWLSSVDPERDTWIFEEDGRLVAFGWHELTGPLSFSIGIVHPDRRGQGLGTALVETGVHRAREAGSTRLHWGALAADPGAPALLAAHGFREVRRIYESVGMTPELEQVVFERALA
jgi:GNAT superfamily N-acetyltransferase